MALSFRSIAVAQTVSKLAISVFILVRSALFSYLHNFYVSDLLFLPRCCPAAFFARRADFVRITGVVTILTTAAQAPTSRCTSRC
jgi:hypothetical protein